MKNKSNINLGYRPNKLEQLLISSIVPKIEPNEKIIVHFVFENSHRVIHAQIERRSSFGISFEKFFLEQD